jgi:undecaprenyl-diphosphatase
MHRFEKKIVLMFNGNKSKAIDFFSALISSILFLFTFWAAIAVFIIIRDLQQGVFVCFGLVIVFIIHLAISEGIIKYCGKLLLTERRRPYKAYPEEIRAIGKKFLDSSLPSSHVASMVGGLVVLAYFYQFLWPWAIIVVVLVSWSRMHNGMHYPSDILAGIVLGLAYGYLTLLILGML